MKMSARPRWQGEQGRGNRDYSDVEYARVVRAMRSIVGREHAMRQQDFAALPDCAGIEPRALRAILSDADGVEFVIVEEGPDGRYVAAWAEETEGTTRNLAARARSLADRVERRRAFAETHLPRRQTTLGDLTGGKEKP